MNNIDEKVDPRGIPGFVLWQVSKLWQRYLSSALKPFGIGSTEFVVLGNAVRLSQMGIRATQTMLVEATKVDRMTASQTLRSLERKGLVERFDLAADKRTFHVAPTKSGTKIADDGLGEVIKAHTKFFEPLKDKMGPFLEAMQVLIEEGDLNG